jgi:hypothetical protein
MTRPQGGRPVVRLTTTLSAEAGERLETIARAQKCSVSWLMARAIDAFLDHYEDDAAPQLPLRRPRSK